MKRHLPSAHQTKPNIPMEELKNQIIAKLGIDPAQAEGAIHAVIEFVKTKLPEGMHGLIDGAINGGEGGAAGGDLLEQAKGLLGGFLK